MADRGAGLPAGDVTGAGGARRPVRERAARAVGAVLVLILIAAVLTTAVGWVITPPVNDLPDRVRNLLERHGGGGVLVLPQPDRAGEALVATEDHRFYSHHGLDPFGVARVAWAAAHGRDAGGATIDQQLAKMVYGQGHGGLLAEFDEAVLALKIDHEYPKDQILSAYLTVVYFGHGYYGLDQAAGGYFGVTPAELSWGQASLLAGLVLAPSAYDPLLHFDAARERQRHVLDRLVAAGDLTTPRADAAFASPLGLRSGT